MEKQELEIYKKLNEKFEKACRRVTNELSRFDSDEYGFCDFYYISDGGEYVSSEGDEYWSFGGHDHHRCSFPSELLVYSDDELREYVDAKIAERDERNKKEKEKDEERKRNNELAELAILKKKYETN